jgi:hypothetical protein
MGSMMDVFNAYRDETWTNPPLSNMEAAEKYLSDGFQILDQDGSVQMERAAYIGMSQMLFAAFKDFSVVYGEVREEGDSLIVTSHFEGTHTSDLDLSAMGMGVIPASGKKIVWPEASTKWTTEGDQVASIQANDANGGIGPFMAALGVKMPSA